MGDFVFEFGRELEAAAEQDERVAVGFGDAQDVLEAAHQHRVALVQVELQVAQQHDVARAVGWANMPSSNWRASSGSGQAVTRLSFIDQALGGGPGVKTAFEVGAGGGDFRFGPRFLGTDDRKAGVAGAEVGG
jgi:hypothetical protein